MLARYLPILRWAPTLDRDTVRADLVAGLTVAVMLVPQGMAYAMLAGLPPIVGLYASVVPLFAYALFGTSRQLAVGPVAMDSLLTASTVGAIAASGTDAYLTYAVALALLTGLVQLAMGVLRIGFVTNFLSRPVLAGFTSAAALIIATSQLKHLLGLDLARSSQVHEVWMQAVLRLSEVSTTTLLVAGGATVTLVALRRWNRSFPGALVVVVLGTLAVWGLGLDARGVDIVGAVPAGFAPLALPTLDRETLGVLGPGAVTIALVGFMEAISVAKVYAEKNRYEVDANQELIGLGVANLAGSLFSAYPVTGGFSRTAVNAQAGAKTGLAAMFTAAFVGLAVLFLTPLFHYLPKAVLAAIIVTAVVGLLEVAEAKRLWRVKRADFWLMAVTFAATLGIGIQQGILVGVGASLLWFVVRTTRPHLAVLGRLPNGAYRNVKNYPEARPHEGVLIVRMDAQFYFGNVSFLKDSLRALEAEHRPEVVILDASAMNQIDASADSALHDLARDYAERGVALRLARVKRPVRDVLERSGFVAAYGDQLFLTIDDAVAGRASADRGVRAPAPAATETPWAGATPSSLPAATKPS